MKTFIGLDYAKHPEAEAEIMKIVNSKISSIVGGEDNPDWLSLVKIYTSNEYNGTRESVKSDLVELLGVILSGVGEESGGTRFMAGEGTPQEVQGVDRGLEGKRIRAGKARRPELSQRPEQAQPQRG